MSVTLQQQITAIHTAALLVEEYLEDAEVHKKTCKRYEVIRTLYRSQKLTLPTYISSTKETVSQFFQVYNLNLSINFSTFGKQRKGYHQTIHDTVIESMPISFPQDKQRVIFFCPGEVERSAIKLMAPNYNLVFVDHEMPWLKRQAAGVQGEICLRVRDLTRGLWKSCLGLLHEANQVVDFSERRVALHGAMDKLKLIAETFSSELQEDDDLNLGKPADHAVALNVTSELSCLVGKAMMEFALTSHWQDKKLYQKLLKCSELFNSLNSKVTHKFFHCLKRVVKPEGTILFGDTISACEYPLKEGPSEKNLIEKFPKDQIKELSKMFTIIDQSKVFWPMNRTDSGNGFGFWVHLYFLQNKPKG